MIFFHAFIAQRKIFLCFSITDIFNRTVFFRSGDFNYNKVGNNYDFIAMLLMRH